MQQYSSYKLIADILQRTFVGCCQSHMQAKTNQNSKRPAKQCNAKTHVIFAGSFVFINVTSFQFINSLVFYNFAKN